MLIRSSLLGPIDAGLSSVPDNGKQGSSSVWISGNGSWQDPIICDEDTQLDQPNTIQVSECKKKDDILCSLDFLSSLQLSNTSEISTPNFVYKRTIQKKGNNSDATDVSTPNPSPTHTVVYKRRKVQSENSKSGSVDGGSVGKDFIEDPKCKVEKCSNLRAVNESCSSSKSNLDLRSGSTKHQPDDAGECSSSSVEIIEGSESCISFLRQHGVLERELSRKSTGFENNSFCLRACKVCDRSTTTLKMLICDLCEESFHMSCCNPLIKKVPVGDWFCNSCSRKKPKIIKAGSRKSSRDCLGPIESMLRDADRYKSNVCIGEDFQAEVPDWSGPVTDELNDYIQLMEISSSECASSSSQSLQDWDYNKLSKLSSIGNWLQCQEVIDGDGNICGKWRRAPLFEVQTDKWECFCSVLWDPTHADCAVPQEVDTDQVLKQLKYIEMLRPRLSTKRWKMRGKGVNQ
ncbi:uncharacterized protein [Rutidosis leptorrhynchoides]|uniref:uncharacterized protein n=1 Tax=Rutidosis leptorrhynchoides TaxID=125765 RepID=UPI003A99407A